ncbi:DUF2827 family protein [Novosphingobium sp. Fuku2-ISO-50]|uniref:DUF2827 family protein n=1 Tax=Novosphingobium sp. Fuku2-ISO-50 TaxID=1739114 RepID=UPI00076C1926|nr:DUF2827 family protein [Novosphingobium sp. Fuku2-ISO-50]KUR78719.1 hypothetical protein AQZ50_05985 [Novosphingobium sp. Fuku2-ISO-50]
MQVGIAFANAASDAFGLARRNRAAWHLLEVLGKGAGVACRIIAEPTAPDDIDPLSPAEAARCCDLIIAVGQDLALADIAPFRARGGRYVLFLPDNPYAGWVEHSIFDRGAEFGPVECHDEIWTFDTFRNQERLLHTLYRCPVRFVPRVWSASVIERHDRQQAEGAGFVLAYAPRCGGALRCVINEPNTTARKMGVIPLLAVNRFHTENPGAIARVAYRHGVHLPDQLTFNFIAANCEVHHQGLLTIWDDRDFFAFLPNHADFVFAHNGDGSVEFDHLDTLHAGYPLLHNVPALSDLGHYYADSDIDRAVALLGDILLANPAHFEARRAETRRKLRRFDVANDDVVAVYQRAVMREV